MRPKAERLKAVYEEQELEVTYGYTDSYGKRKLKSYDLTEEAIRLMQVIYLILMTARNMHFSKHILLQFLTYS